MAFLFWVLLPCLAAAGSALLATLLMQARMDGALARQRQSLVEARALLLAQQNAEEARIRAAAVEARRKALDDFLSELRVDERSFVRVHARKTIVLQERLYFRNVPLTPWRRREYDVEGATGLTPVASRRALEAPRQNAAALAGSAATCP